MAQTDLEITKGAPATVIAGNQLAYTITVTNNGPSDALNVNVTDTTPAGLVFISNAGDCTTAFPCALGTVPAGESRVITATFQVPSSYTAPSPIVNITDVTTTTTETNLLNNTATANTTLQLDADLGITKTGPATIAAGDTIVYTTVITNNGPSDAVAVQVDDPTPANLVFVSNTGDCVTAFPCALGSIPAGESRTITSSYPGAVRLHDAESDHELGDGRVEHTGFESGEQHRRSRHHARSAERRRRGDEGPVRRRRCRATRSSTRSR